ncbi:MAG: glutaredoxin family protein [candidate division Zixibacteria bacterium]|nr:glutaredoxin family protein [candidate division Zixibacteria bacterium]
MSEVIMYTKPGCPYCAAAKAHYEEKGIEYQEFDVKADSSAAEKAAELAGGKHIVPVIVDGGEVKLGFGGS